MNNMNIKGVLIGFDRITSKKGTDCFFAWVETKFSENSSGVGIKCENICAFSNDSSDLQDKVMKGKLLNQKVEVIGMRQGNSFIAVDIKPLS